MWGRIAAPEFFTEIVQSLMKCKHLLITDEAESEISDDVFWKPGIYSTHNSTQPTWQISQSFSHVNLHN